MKVFLSAGHTAARPGARAGGLVEFDLNARTVDLIGDQIREVEPVLVPRVALRDRIAFVNRWGTRGDFALEVHHNAAVTWRAHGVEVYRQPLSTGGDRLARAVLGAIVELGRRNRGVRDPLLSQHPRLGWIRARKPWAALLEVEFLTNPGARAWLVDGGTEAVAKAVAEALDRCE